MPCSVYSRLRSCVQLCCVVLAALGCQVAPVRLVVVTSSVAQTVSLLGDTLYTLPLDPGTGPSRVDRLNTAREEIARDSSNLKAWLQLGRSTMEMGRLREAVEIYSKILQVYYTDPRVYRERGEVLLRLRQLTLAVADLRKAGLLALGQGPLLEPPSEVEYADVKPGLSLTTVQYQTFFLLGIALYCKADYDGAYKVLAEAAGIALTADQRSRAMLWLFFALRRMGAVADARSVLAMVEPAWAEGARFPDISLLLAYKGLLPSDSIQARALALKGEERSLYSYGIAYYLLLQKDKEPEAELWLTRARSGGNWATLPYIAAEADLARLRAGPVVPIK